MISLNEEVQQYYNEVIDSSNIPREHWELEIQQLVSDFVQSNPKCIKAKLIQAQIDILNSLFDRGLKNVYQAMTSPINTYKDIINPLIKELQKELDSL